MAVVVVVEVVNMLLAHVLVVVEVVALAGLVLL